METSRQQHDCELRNPHSLNREDMLEDGIV